MNRALAGLMIIIASVAGFMMVAAANPPEGVLLFSGVAMLCTGIAGLALLLGVEGEPAARSGDVNVNVYGHQQPPPGWMHQPPAQPQIIMVPMQPHLPHPPAGMQPEMVHQMLSDQARAFQDQHAMTMMQLQQSFQAALGARQSPPAIEGSVYRGQIASAPQKASLAGQAVRLIGRSGKKMFTG